MITKTDTALTKHLLDNKMVAPEALEPLVAEAVKSKDSLYALLLKKNIVDEDKLLKALSDTLSMPVLTDAELKIEPGVVEKVPLKVSEYYKIAPLKIVKRKLTIAVSQPLDIRTQDDMRAQLGYEIETVLAREKDITEAVKRFYGFAAGTIGDIVAAGSELPQGSAGSAESVEKLENLETMVGDASIVMLVNQIILEAYRKRATDIHIEPYRGKVKLRYRIDGVLYNANVPAEMSRLILPVLSRIKIMSNLNIVEKRMPQDGRAIVKVEDTQLDLRVSSIPTPYGESIVIRMLPMNRTFHLESLGLNPDQLKTFIELINKPHGVIFITGPTGSGKSTTLYACLNKINTDERKIITIEDPVEYEMEGVTQIQVQSNIGLDFARGLRSMLRHDPDVMMVGEVRDQETAESAIRSALTGHLVFSTLHTNDSASGITRLIDIGVAPYLVASSVEAFVAQRLVRVICPHCKEEDKTPGIEEIKLMIGRELHLNEPQKIKIMRGKGCNKCNQTGFWGRLAVYEILLSTEPIKRLIMKRAAASEIKQTAVYQGMSTLRQDGWRKVVQGLTTPDEILEIAQEEGQKDEGVEESPLAPFFDEKKFANLDAFRAAAEKAAPEKKGAEKRVFERIDESINVRYRVMRLPAGSQGEPDGAEQFTATRNLSAGGLVFISKEMIPFGAILELKVEIPDGDPAMGCLAKIVRIAEADGKGLLEKAVCFLDLQRADRARLEKFISGAKK